MNWGSLHIDFEVQKAKQVMSEDECPNCGRAWYVWFCDHAVDIDGEWFDQYTCGECGYTAFAASTGKEAVEPSRPAALGASCENCEENPSARRVRVQTDYYGAKTNDVIDLCDVCIEALNVDDKAIITEVPRE